MRVSMSTNTSNSRVLTEYSEPMNDPRFANRPNVLRLIRAMHSDSKFSLPHNASFTDFKFTDNEDLNKKLDSKPYIWIIFGTGGAAGLYVSGRQVKALKIVNEVPSGSADYSVFDKPELCNLYSYSPKVKLSWYFQKLRPFIGSISKTIVTTRGSDIQKVKTLKSKRSKIAPTDVPVAKLSNTKIAINLLMRFRPVWERYIIQALASIQEDIRRYTKNHNYVETRELISRAQRLYDFLNNPSDKIRDIDMSGPTSNPIVHAMQLALLHASMHYYPEQHRDYNPRNSPNLTLTKPDKLLSDIAAGDTEKIGTVLYYFKRGLLLQ